MARYRYAWVALSAALVGCGGADGTSSKSGQAIDLMNDFVPGDPDFERDAALDVENISRHGELRSHTRSRNCLSCHQTEGPGRGVFTIAGSLVDEQQRPYRNGILRLFAAARAPGGGPVEWGGPVELTDLVLEVELDENGNFFTTEALPDFFPAQPIYPQFFSEQGEPLFKADGKSHAVMGSGATVGGCNFCHGASFPIVGRDSAAEAD
jgi:hypothetical protein